MPTKAIYKPVSAGNYVDDDADDGENDHGVVVFEIDGFDDDDNDDKHNGAGLEGEYMIPDDVDDDENDMMGHIQPMELEMSSHSFSDDDFIEHLFGFQDPWFPSILVTLLLEVPALLGNVFVFHDIFGAWFPSTLFALHLLFVLCTARYLVGCRLSVLTTRQSRIYTSIASLIDILLLGILYQVIWWIFISQFFTEVDGTTSIEWSGYKRRFQFYRALATVAMILRAMLGINAIGLRAASASIESSFSSTPTFLDRYCTCPNSVLSRFLYLDSHLQKMLRSSYCAVSLRQKMRIRRALTWFFSFALVPAFFLLGLCLYSCIIRIGSFAPPVILDPENCDPLDETECWLPFPSYHLMKADNSSETGWRLDLRGDLLPPLKSGNFIHPDFGNVLDGFSTMAPMLFYLEGLKEAHEAGIGQLKGTKHISESLTAQSATVLLDVGSKQLVAHSAEIDYLDGKNPLVMIFPSRPLKHNCHYAVAVINATDAKRERLPPSRGMKDIFSDNQTHVSSTDTDRRSRYIEVVIPALEKAARWFEFSQEPDSLQLLFDFHTISEDSQLGSVRKVRDATMKQISSDKWKWKDHVKTIRKIDYDCALDDAVIARTIHAELDVPWFLSEATLGPRSAFLDDEAVDREKSNGLGTGKFLVHLPCSLRSAALGSSENPRELRAVMEYGHGLFGNRAEADSYHLTHMADVEGYAIIAMDWRGMSQYDQLMVLKVLVSTPRMFQAVRDNLIQGYASKYALQHFSRHGMLSMDWFVFDDEKTGMSKSVPTLGNKPPAQVYYGISQGGILGAGYSALSGVTGLIDRAVLGSPGTPFALIMTRSVQFLDYDKLLLFDFYDNRHVRLLLNLVQLAWDSVEASGVLALPVKEPYPRVLIQTGLGDSVVPSLAAEALGRAFNASSLPNSPRTVYGISRESAATETSKGPYATLTEVMFDSEYLTMSEDNNALLHNRIHWCLRYDEAIIAQVAEFINTGRVVDACVDDDRNCHRTPEDSEWCF